MALGAVQRDVVVLVDEAGAVLGSAGKIAAHEPPGQLHLAISVVLYRLDGLLILQQRAATKYHFPLFWANACCSHPRPGELPAVAAEARVEEELGVACALRPAGSFLYRATCPTTGLVEYELDHVFVGELDLSPRPDPNEVAAVAFVAPTELFDGSFAGPSAPWLVPAVRLAEQLRSVDEAAKSRRRSDQPSI